MKLKSTIIKPWAKRIARKIDRQARTAVEDQSLLFKTIVQNGRKTHFGRHHGFNKINDYRDFKDRVAVRDYEKLKKWIDRIVEGESNVLWPGRPKYFAKTSGTTSGAKYIPITGASMPNHFNTARNCLFYHGYKNRNLDFIEGKMIFLSGSPRLDKTGDIPTGRLSGIVNHAVPAWLRKNQLPSYTTNCIDDWDHKIEAIIGETADQPMTLISGIPPWVKDYFEKLIQCAGKNTIEEIFPSLTYLVHGGVNFEPYKQAFDQLIGGVYHDIETYPASEGFIAWQDGNAKDGLLLNTNSGIFFEFIPMEELGLDSPSRMSLTDVEPGVNYAVILNTTAGLWAYDLGDTVEFVSIDPWRIKVTGRVAHFISAFGEHVISKEIEKALQRTAQKFHLQIAAFTVAPKIDTTDKGQSCHQWILECELPKSKVPNITKSLDEAVRDQNSYYDDLRRGHMLIQPEVVVVTAGTFAAYMRSKGKLGGQNKVPVVSNDRNVADGLLAGL